MRHMNGQRKYTKSLCQKLIILQFPKKKWINGNKNLIGENWKKNGRE